METYDHPGLDWALVHRLLAPSKSRARQVIAKNLDWLQQLVTRRNGDLMLVSARGATRGVVGAAGLSCDGSAVVVHFYFVVEGQEDTGALAGLYRMMVQYAKRHNATVIRIPAFVKHGLPSEHQFYGRIASAHVDGPWQSGDVVRTYSIQLEKFFDEASL